MQYEWDETKSEITRKERGFGFEIMEAFNWNYAICADAQVVDGEHRELWIGPVNSNLFTTVIVEREADIIRIVSLRRASNVEIKLWRKEFQNE